MSRRVSALLFAFTLFGCSGDEAPQILTRWTYTGERPLSAAARGPEGRVIVADKENPAQLITFSEQLGATVDGPFDVFPSLHAPVVLGADIFLVSSIGRIVHTNLAGQTLAEPGLTLGLTAPAVAAPDGSLRVAATSGRLVGFTGDGTILFDVTYAGAADTAPAVDANGTTYVATDTGQVYGFDAAGTEVFNKTVAAPAAGPSVRDGVITVGHATGVTAFDSSGTEVFTRARAARVTGTSILADGNILAWGEDGAVELLDKAGAVQMSFVAGPPIYAPVIPLEGAFAIIDDEGNAHLVDRDGTSLATIALGGKPARQLVSGVSVPFVFVTIDKTLTAVDFTSRGAM